MAAQYTHSVVSADCIYAYQQYRDIEVATKQSFRQPPLGRVLEKVGHLL
jgi:hypothetical protein